MIYEEPKCRLSEGPLRHPNRGELFWFDILEKRLHIKGRNWKFSRYASAASWINFGETSWGSDGAVVDSAGRFWKAQWGASRVACDNEDSTLAKTVAFPGVQFSCPAFGSTDLKILFYTSAQGSLIGEDDGKTFATPVEAIGQAEHLSLIHI